MSRMLLLDLPEEIVVKCNALALKYSLSVVRVNQPSEAIAAFFKEDWEISIVAEQSFVGRVHDIAKAFKTMPRREKSCFFMLENSTKVSDDQEICSYYDYIFRYPSDFIKLETTMLNKGMIKAKNSSLMTKIPFTKEEGNIDESHTVTGLLLMLAEKRFTGQFKLENQKNVCQLTFVNGIVVSAVENAIETRLGTLLVQKNILTSEEIQKAVIFGKEHKLRMAESIIRLKLLTVEAILKALKEQTHERCIRAVGWSAGRFTVLPQAINIDKQVMTQFDVREAILSWLNRVAVNKSVLNLWLKENSTYKLLKTVDFVEGFKIFTKIHPNSVLIELLKEPFEKAHELAQKIKNAHKGDAKAFLQCVHSLYALQKAAVLSFEYGEQRQKELPVAHKVEEETIEQSQRKRARELQELWLQVQGRDYFEILNVPYSTSCKDLENKLATFTQKYLSEENTANLVGQAGTLSAQLCGMVAEMKWTLCDEDHKNEYIKSLNLPPVKVEVGTSIQVVDEPPKQDTFEQDLEVAENALRREDWSTAKIILDELKKKLPGNARVEANWAFIEMHLCISSAKDFLVRLEMVQENNPETGDFLYLLGRAKSLLGNDEAAIEDLLAAKQKCPYASYIDGALEKLLAEGQLLDDDDDDDFF